MTKKKVILVSALVLIVLIAVGATAYYFVPKQKQSSSGSGSGGGGSGKSSNPVAGLSDAEAVAAFDESFVKYILSSIGAQRLHPPPLGSDLPRIEVVAGDISYNAVINKKSISVKEGAIDNEDITIITTKEEAVKMLRDKSYVTTSFQNGNSGIRLVASRPTLFGKGYLQIYEELTGSTTE